MLQLYTTLVPWSTLSSAVTLLVAIVPLLIGSAVHSLKNEKELQTLKQIILYVKMAVLITAGFPKVGRIAPLGAILVSWGAKTCKGAKGGRF